MSATSFSFYRIQWKRTALQREDPSLGLHEGSQQKREVFEENLSLLFVQTARWNVILQESLSRLHLRCVIRLSEYRLKRSLKRKFSPWHNFWAVVMSNNFLLFSRTHLVVTYFQARKMLFSHAVRFLNSSQFLFARNFLFTYQQKRIFPLWLQAQGQEKLLFKSYQSASDCVTTTAKLFTMCFVTCSDLKLISKSLFVLFNHFLSRFNLIQFQFQCLLFFSYSLANVFISNCIDRVTKRDWKISFHLSLCFFIGWSRLHSSFPSLLCWWVSCSRLRDYENTFQSVREVFHVYKHSKGKRKFSFTLLCFTWSQSRFCFHSVLAEAESKRERTSEIV